MTDVARLLRRLLPVLAAAATAAATALPAAAATASPAGQTVTRAGEWWLAALHVPAAQPGAQAAGKGVTVAVLSTGVDASHQDLAGSVTSGPDLSGTGRTAGGQYWGAEGTAVASLIAGHGHGSGGADGITGVAPGARILSVQVTLEYDDPLNSDAAVTRHLPDAIAAGIRYAVGHGATVIALPLDPGTLGDPVTGDPAAAGGSAAERAAVSFALAHGVLLVAPAGDNGAGTDSPNYPAAYPGVIAVGATARDGQLALFTNTHSYVTLAAPGAGDTPDVPVPGGAVTDPAAGMTVADPDGGYESLASTDMAAALTAGVAALIRSRYPRLTVAEVTQALERGATAPPGGRAAAGGWGHGELNAAAALTAAAAIAAAHPAPVPSAPPASPSARPAVSVPVHQAAPGNAAPGNLLRSLVVDLAIAAGLLIAFLIGAIALIRLRRRPRAAVLSDLAAAVRPGRTASRPRHARGHQGQGHGQVAVRPTRTVIWPSSPGQIRPSSPAQRRHPDGEPPWPPALPPAGQPVPRALLPARPEPEPPSVQLAPWEQSPSAFAPVPAQEAAPPWPPLSSTGPIYVWNPATTTGPLPILNDDEEA